MRMYVNAYACVRVSVYTGDARTQGPVTQLYCEIPFSRFMSSHSLYRRER